MHKQLRIESSIQKGSEIRFLLSTTAVPGIPSGKMITDSDEITFVYLLEESKGYSQIHFPQAVWPIMVEVLKSNQDPTLFCGEETITLIGFIDELTMLIFNIEGNNNYGEAFSTAVENAFEQILQST